VHRSALHDDLRATLALALPAVAQSLLQTLVFLADRFFLGHHSAAALAAMQIAGPLTWTLQSVFGAFGVGTLAVIGRAVGAGDRRLAASALYGSLVPALALGLLVGGVSALGLQPLVDVLGGGASTAVRGEAARYLGVVLPAMPLLFVAMVCTQALQAGGDTRTPLVIAIATNALNLALNAVLIFGRFGLPRLGARGAAIANVSAFALEAALSLAALSRRDRLVSLRAVGPLDVRAGMRRVLRVSLGAFGERALYHTGYLVYVRITNGLGPVAMAAHQALLSLESVSFLSADGFGVAAGSRVAQRLGAGDPGGARRAGWIAAGTSAALIAVVAVCLYFGAEGMLRVFLDDPAAIREGVRAMLPGALVQVPMVLSIVLLQSLRGAGATREAFGIAVLGSFVVRIAATLFFVQGLHLGLAGVWLGSGCDWILRAALAAWRWQLGHWARVKV
jgi:putative MATE family efflux protein